MDEQNNTPTGETPPAAESEVVFTPEQQAKVDELVAKAMKKAKAKADKEAEAEKLTESEKLEKARAQFERERSQFRAQTLLQKEGFLLTDEQSADNETLVDMFTCEAELGGARLAAVKKLIESKVQAEVDKRLRGSATPPPQKGKEKSESASDIIGGAIRAAIKK